MAVSCCQCASLCLKNLLVLDGGRALGELLVPFLLDALSGRAVSLSHMAPGSSTARSLALSLTACL